MASFMATRFFAAGHKIVNVYARKMKEAKKLSKPTESLPVNDFMNLDEATDIVIFALPDMVLREVVLQFPFKNKIFIHCAGTQSLEVLDQENRGIIWPLFSINQSLLPTERNIPIFWEAHGDLAQKVIPELVSALTDVSQQADLKKRQELHLSAVFVNNFVNHLMSITIQRMQHLELPFNESLKPIIEQTIQIALKGKSAESQTGPAIRMDATTIETHLRLLASHPEWQNIYQSLTKSIQLFYHLPKIQ